MSQKSKKKPLIIGVLVAVAIIIAIAIIVPKQIAISNIKKMYPEVAEQMINEFMGKVASGEEYRRAEYSKKYGLTDVTVEVVDIDKERDGGKDYYIISLNIECQCADTELDDISKSLVAYEVEDCLDRNSDYFEVGKYRCRYYGTENRSSELYLKKRMTVYLNGELVHSPTYNIGEIKVETWKNVTNDDDRNICWGLSLQAVKQQLKSPSSAKFAFSYGSDGVTIEQKGDTFRVKSYVDADNSFGASIRNNFTVYIEKSGSNFTVTSCTIEER